jgi:uncharacterized protein (DUF58 family)
VLTTRGWSVLGAGVGLYFGGRIVGLGQLDVLAGVCVLLLGGVAVWAATRPIDLAIERVLPERLTVGAEGRVDLTVTTRARRTPTLLVTDQFDGGRRTARFRTPSLEPGEEARAAYRVPTDRRGRFTLGPLRVAVTDPFGLVERTVLTGPTDEVLVYPRVHDILELPEAGGQDLDHDAPPQRRRPESGNEFLTLREYELGDDLRRVHWRSTARRDELMIRQEESRRRAPVLIVLDVRPTAHSRAGFERAVEAAASVVHSFDRAARDAELVDSTGLTIGTQGRRHEISVLDELAVIETSGPSRFGPALLRRRASLVVVVAGHLTTHDHAALGALASSSGRLVVVDTAAARGAPVTTPARMRRSVVPAADDGTFPQRWNEMVLRWRDRRARSHRSSLSRV